MGDSSGGFVIQGPGEVFRFLQVWHGLSIQASTGLRHSRGSLIKLSQQRYGTRSRTAAGTLEELRPVYDAITQARVG